MLYLDTPPSGSQPVEIRDIGGFVHEYEKQTRRFQSEGREVRLLYCRSACTMALSLPKACVYPHSKLFFHMAFNPKTGERREKESADLFALYPAKVRARLGRLTPQNQMLTGTELISLGVPECGGTTMIARANSKAKPVTLASADGSSPAAPAEKPGVGEAAKKPAVAAVARLVPGVKAATAEPAPRALAATSSHAGAAAGSLPGPNRAALAAVAEPGAKPKAIAVASLDREPSTVAALLEKAMRFTGVAPAPESVQKPAPPPVAARVEAPPKAPKRVSPAPDHGPATTASIAKPAGVLAAATDAARTVTSKIVGSVLSLFR